MAGVVTIRVIKGQNLPNYNAPYFQVTVGKKTEKTAVKNNNPNPVYKETFQFVYDSSIKKTILLECYDEADGEIILAGSLKIPFGDYAGTFSLVSDNEEAGMVELQLLTCHDERTSPSPPGANVPVVYSSSTPVSYPKPSTSPKPSASYFNHATSPLPSTTVSSSSSKPSYSSSSSSSSSSSYTPSSPPQTSPPQSPPPQTVSQREYVERERAVKPQTRADPESSRPSNREVERAVKPQTRANPESPSTQTAVEVERTNQPRTRGEVQVDSRPVKRSQQATSPPPHIVQPKNLSPQDEELLQAATRKNFDGIYLKTRKKKRELVPTPVIKYVANAGIPPEGTHTEQPLYCGKDGRVCGGKDEPLTSFYAIVEGKPKGVNGDVRYSVQEEEVGWVPFFQDGAKAGTGAHGLLGIKIELTGDLTQLFDVWYAVLLSEGWTDWQQNGTVAGVVEGGGAEKDYITAVRIEILPKE